MANKIYVGNISFKCGEDDLSRHLTSFGAKVIATQIITDRDTGKSKGFGFVEVSDDTDMRQVIEQANGSNLDGRSLTVNEARPKAPRKETGSDYGNGGRRERY